MATATLPTPLKRSVIALFPYLRRAETFEHYTLAKWVENFSLEKDPESELLWWNHIILVTIHTVKLLELFPCATTSDEKLMGTDPPGIESLSLPETVRHFRALDDACVKPLLGTVLMRFSGSCSASNMAQKLPNYVSHVVDVADSVIREKVTHIQTQLVRPPAMGVENATAATRQCNGCC